MSGYVLNGQRRVTGGTGYAATLHREDCRYAAGGMDLESQARVHAEYWIKAKIGTTWRLCTVCKPARAEVVASLYSQ